MVVTGVFPLDGVTVKVPLVLHALDSVTDAAPLSKTSPRVTDDNNRDPVPVVACHQSSVLLAVRVVEDVVFKYRFSLLTVLLVFPSR